MWILHRQHISRISLFDPLFDPADYTLRLSDRVSHSYDLQPDQVTTQRGYVSFTFLPPILIPPERYHAQVLKNGVVYSQLFITVY